MPTDTITTTRADRVAQADARTMTDGEARRLASVAYAGWRGWYHNWHWPENVPEAVMFARLRDEARGAAAEMEAAIADLRDRQQASARLAVVLDAAIRMLEEDDGHAD